MTDTIKVFNANENNLKNVNLEIPKNNLSYLQDLVEVENLHSLLILFMRRVNEDI